VLLLDNADCTRLCGQEPVPANAALHAVVIDHSMRRQKIAVGNDYDGIRYEGYVLMVSDGDLKILMVVVLFLLLLDLDIPWCVWMMDQWQLLVPLDNFQVEGWEAASLISVRL